MGKVMKPGKVQLKIGQILSTISETNPPYLSHSNIYKNNIGTLKHQIKINNHSKSRIKNKKLKINKQLFLSKSQSICQNHKISKINQKLKYNFFKKVINKLKSNLLMQEFRFSNKNNLTKRKTNKTKAQHIQTLMEIKNMLCKQFNSCKVSS